MSSRDNDRVGDEARLGQLEELNREALRIRAAVADTTGTAESPDGLIEATVGVYGELVELDLDPRIFRRQDATALAEQIRATVNSAYQEAQDKVRRELVGAGPEAEGLAFGPLLNKLEAAR
ncbi:YbaB/EbfC family nucleoid-associated protein [Kribbella sp. WER1]